MIGLGKAFVGRAEDTEAHIVEALRRSPRDTTAYLWLQMPGHVNVRLGKCEQAVLWLQRSIEANRNFPITHFELAAPLARLGRLDEAPSAVRSGLALSPTFAIFRARAMWTAMSDNPAYLAQLELLLEAMRVAGVPES